MDLTKLMDQRAADNHRSDTLNPNIGSEGTNLIYDKAQGDRGKHMNPTWRPNQTRPGAPDDEEAEGDVFGSVDGAD
jgi:hypothetical protein